MSRENLLARIQLYVSRHGLTLGRELGFGVHGIVFDAENQAQGLSAIKAHQREADYLRERDVYLRLRENDVTEIRGCRVPQLYAFDDELWVIEMSVVTRPFVLDFAGAYLDGPPDFSEEVLDDWRKEKIDQFDKRWPEVQAILGALEGLGIYLIDVHPNNISWPD
jgi:hypothetical protein